MRALLRPSALLMHLPVVLVMAVLVSLGQWQLDRLDQVRRSNELLERRMAEAPLDLVALARSGPLQPDQLEFRRVTAVGSFRPEEEVLQRNRVNRGFQGLDVLTPFDLGDGQVILVRRGWVPATLSTPPVAEALPPTGVIRIEGLLERTVEQPTFGARDPEDGRLLRVFHPDTARLDRQMTGSLLGMVLRLDGSAEQDSAALPVAVGPPTLDAGSHLSYAVQWHIFALLALIAYAAWWRTRLRKLTPL
jgi:surfeit locus 1 family protein